MITYTGYQMKVWGTRFPNAGPLGRPGAPDVNIWQPGRFGPGYGAMEADPLKEYWLTPSSLNRHR